MKKLLMKTSKILSVLAIVSLIISIFAVTPVFAEESNGETGDSEEKVTIVLIDSNTAQEEAPATTVSAEKPEYGYSNISLSTITTGILWGASFIIGVLLFLQYRRDHKEIQEMKVYYNSQD